MNKELDILYDKPKLKKILTMLENAQTKYEVNKALGNFDFKVPGGKKNDKKTD